MDRFLYNNIWPRMAIKPYRCHTIEANKSIQPSYCLYKYPCVGIDWFCSEFDHIVVHLMLIN
jgi:hypothetical protein